MARINNHKSSIFDLDANLVTLIMYAAVAILGFSPGANLLTFAVPFIAYGVEKKSEYVKKNAIQALTISIGSTLIYVFFTIISFAMTPRCSSNYVCFGSAIIHKAFGFYGSLRWMVAAFIFIVCLIVALRSYNYEESELNELSKFNLKIKKLMDKILKGQKEAKAEEKIKSEEEQKEDIKKNKKEVKPKPIKKKTSSTKKAATAKKPPIKKSNTKKVKE